MRGAPVKRRRTRAAAAYPAPDARRVDEIERRGAELMRRVETAERARAELLWEVSHDLRNPLGVILVTATLLARELEEDPGQKRQVDAIKRAADEINQLVEDLVDAASIEAGRFAIGPSLHDAATLVDAAHAAAAAVTAHKPIVLHKEVAQPLPPVLADRSRIVQVFLRLVGNAARFMSRGGTITIRGEPTVDGARFSVTDTGPGIPEAHRELLFARHAPAGRRACQGTGLGVFVAKGIVEAHGGTVGAESEPGRGSTLYFTLPAVDPELLEEEVS